MARRGPPAPAGFATSLWDMFFQLPEEVQILILRVLSKQDKCSVRKANKYLRKLLNSLVTAVMIADTADIAQLAAIDVVERFPNVASLTVSDKEGALTDASFADFAVSLASSSILCSLSLTECKTLGTAGIFAVTGSCRQLRELELPESSSITNKSIAPLSSLRRLTRLVLNGTGVSSGLKHLATLKKLRSLSICNCADIRDKDIEHLSALAKLEELRAASTGIEGQTLAALKRLRHLRLLDVSCTQAASTAAITAIAKLTQLTSLTADVIDVNSTPAPASLAKLSKLTQLQKLSLFGHLLSGAALALLDLPELTHLGALSIQVPSSGRRRPAGIQSLSLMAPSSADLAALLPLQDLSSLTIDVCPDNIAPLQQQVQLTQLSLGGLTSGLSKQLAQVLRALSSLQRLELCAPGLSQACLLAIAGLKQLQTLRLEATQMSGELLILLNRCPKLHSVTLQRCHNVRRAGLLALVCKPGMQEVVVRQVAGLEACAANMQEVAQQLGVSLQLSQDTPEVHFYDQPNPQNSGSSIDSVSVSSSSSSRDSETSSDEFSD